MRPARCGPARCGPSRCGPSRGLRQRLSRGLRPELSRGLRPELSRGLRPELSRGLRQRLSRGLRPEQSRSPAATAAGTVDPLRRRGRYAGRSARSTAARGSGRIRVPAGTPPPVRRRPSPPDGPGRRPPRPIRDRSGRVRGRPCRPGRRCRHSGMTGESAGRPATRRPDPASPSPRPRRVGSKMPPTVAIAPPQTAAPAVVVPRQPGHPAMNRGARTCLSARSSCSWPPVSAARCGRAAG
jgi:hypothetical protein